MYVSQLLIDTGGNPDRPRPGRNWLTNVYNVHRRLCIAFPLHQYKIDDPHNLSPYKPENFSSRPFLFRIDHNIDANENRAIIIVQSHQEPEWDWCFQNAMDFLAAPVAVKTWDPLFATGDTLKFKVLMNAAQKSTVHRTVNAENPNKNQGKRLALTWDKSQDPNQVIGEWFQNKTLGKGFQLTSTELVHLGWVYGYKPKYTPNKINDSTMKFRSAVIEGTLTVSDPDLFKICLETGLGSAKSFGFGMLSVRQI